MKERTAIANAITEDDQVFSLLAQAVAVGPNTTLTNSTGPAQRSDFADLLGVLLSRQLAPGAYVMHPMRYIDILKWGSDQLDQVSLNVIVKTRRLLAAMLTETVLKFGGSLTNLCYNVA